MAKRAEEKSCFGGGGEGVFIRRERGLCVRQKGGCLLGTQILGVTWYCLESLQMGLS